MTRQPTRREALKGLAASLAGATLVDGCGYAPLGRPAGAPPNLIVVLADDQAAKAIGALGHYPFFATPGMDRLVHEGAHFANAFVTTSLCSPARASLLTGCYAHSHGVYFNDVADPPAHLPQFPALLQQAGYRTAFIGKWHMAAGASAEPRPGFDHWLSFPGQGEYEDPLLNDNGTLRRESGYLTDLLTTHAERWITENAHRPFCLILAHKTVHDPRTPAPRHLDAFPDATLPEPASFADDMAGKPAWLRRAVLWGETAAAWAASEGRPIPDRLPPATWDPHDPQRLKYFRCLLALDDSIARLLATLDQLGIDQQTCLVHTSDNGYFLGEHRRNDKRLMYEDSIRVPLLVRYPDLVPPGGVVTPMALNLDIAPTLLALAGVDAPATMHGRSLVPLFAGDDAGWRDAFLYEYWRESWLPGIPSIQGVRTDQDKLIRYPEVRDDLDELYDLLADPLELDNLIDDPDRAARVAELDQVLAQLRAR